MAKKSHKKIRSFNKFVTFETVPNTRSQRYNCKPDRQSRYMFSWSLFWRVVLDGGRKKFTHVQNRLS